MLTSLMPTISKETGLSQMDKLELGAPGRGNPVATVGSDEPAWA